MTDDASAHPDFDAVADPFGSKRAAVMNTPPSARPAQ